MRIQLSNIVLLYQSEPDIVWLYGGQLKTSTDHNLPVWTYHGGIQVHVLLFRSSWTYYTYTKRELRHVRKVRSTLTAWLETDWRTEPLQEPP